MKKYKTTAGLNQRKGASKEYDAIQIIPSGKTVIWYGFSFLDAKGVEWKLVEYAGKMGFCSSKYLKVV